MIFLFTSSFLLFISLFSYGVLSIFPLLLLTYHVVLGIEPDMLSSLPSSFIHPYISLIFSSFLACMHACMDTFV